MGNLFNLTFMSQITPKFFREHINGLMKTDRLPLPMVGDITAPPPTLRIKTFSYQANTYCQLLFQAATY